MRGKHTEGAGTSLRSGCFKQAREAHRRRWPWSRNQEAEESSCVDLWRRAHLAGAEWHEDRRVAGPSETAEELKTMSWGWSALGAGAAWERRTRK